jgi:O-antigen ligase
MAMAVLVALAGALSWRPSLARQLIESKPFTAALLASFVAWAALSSLWSPYPDHIQAPKLAATVLLGLCFAAGATADRESRRLTRAAATAAFLVLAILLAVETFAGMPLNRALQPNAIPWMVERNPSRGAVVLLGLTWAVAGGLFGAGRPQFGLLALAIGGALATQFGQTANIVAFGAGFFAFIAAFMAPRLAVLATSGGLAAWVLAAPFVTPLVVSQTALIDRLPYNLAARAGIWDYVCARILERPWMGHGLDAPRAVTDTIVVHGVAMRAVQLHPHSGSLQIWYETGLVGALLAASALLFGGWAMSRAFARNPYAAAGACGTMACYGIIANVSFGLWQEWWNATMLLAGAVVAAFAIRDARA